MGYRIDFRVGGGVLPRQVLIDIRGLHDRYGRLRAALAWLRSSQL